MICKLLSILVAFMLFTSCTKRSPLMQYIHDADRVEVMLYSGNEPQLQFEANDFDTIQRWMTFISDSVVTATGNCNLEGTLVFVQYNDSLPMQFSLKKGCTQVHYSLKGKTYVQPLTEEGINYIIGLESRKRMFGR